MSITDTTDARQVLVNLSIGFIVLQTLVLGLYYASRYAHEKLITGIEMKFFMPLGYLSCVGNAVLSILLVKRGGAGHHITELDLETMVRLANLFKAEEMIYMASITFPKLAVLSLYIRLFMNPIRNLSFITGIIVVLNFGAGFLAWGLACQPFAFNWNKTIPGGHCINMNMSYTYVSVPNLLSDTAILLLPLQPLWTLHVPRSAKVGLFATFVLGSVGIITAIIRFVSFMRSDIRSDPSFQAADTMRWTIIEPAMYQIAATLPTLRPILTRCLSVFSRLSGTSRGEKSEGGTGGAVAVENRDRFVKLDDYHYIQDSKRSKDSKIYSGDLKTNNTCISSLSSTEMDECGRSQ